MSAPAPPPRERHVALDLARGCAVVGMIYMHLVPTEGAVSVAGRAWTTAARLLEGKSAALFCILAGAAWAIQAERAGGSPRFARYVTRRALALAAAGVVLHAIWPTEILVPLALMMVLALAARRRGAKLVVAAAVLALAAAPAVGAGLGGVIAGDWRADGTPVMDIAPGWATFRYYLFDGSYPVVPWIAFPLVGMTLLAHGLPGPRAARRWCLAALAVFVPAQAWALWAGAHADALGAWAPSLTATWVPTSVPFVLVAGGAALAVIAGFAWWQGGAGRPPRLGPLALVGRASLTHYVAHICLVIVPLRLLWPDEDWPVRVGALAFIAYLAAAVPLTRLWFRRFAHGPLEGGWAWVSGKMR